MIKTVHRQTASWRLGHRESIQLLKEVTPHLMLKKHMAEFILDLFNQLQAKQEEIKTIKMTAANIFKGLKKPISKSIRNYQ